MPLKSSASMKLDRKSLIEKLEAVAVVIGGLRSFPDVPGGLHPAAHEEQPDQRHGNEDLPAQAHDLVIPEAREGGADPDEQRDHEAGLDAKPDPARDEVQEGHR